MPNTWWAQPQAGLVIFYLGADTALAVDALTFWIAAGLVGLIRFETLAASTEPESAVPTEERGYLSALLTGVQTLRQNNLLLLLTGLLASVSFGNMAFTALLVPYVTEHLDASSIGVGLMEGAMSAGFITVSLLAERVMTDAVGRCLLWILPLAIPLVFVALSGTYVDAPQFAHKNDAGVGCGSSWVDCC